VKIAFDENIPIAMVKVFKAFAGEKQFQKISTNLSIESAKDYTPKPGDADYMPGNDAPWICRFAAAGGKVVISGNTDMMWKPHERLALLEQGLIVVFFEDRWNNWKFFTKCALLLFWWPILVARLRTAKPKTFWRILSVWDEKAKLRELSTDDPRMLQIQKRQNAKREKKNTIRAEMERRSKIFATASAPTCHDLMEVRSNKRNPNDDDGK